MSTEAPTAPTADEMLAQIEARIAAIGDPFAQVSIPAQEKAFGERSQLWSWSKQLQFESATLAQAEPQIAFFEKWVSDLTPIRAKLSDELGTITSPVRDQVIKLRADQLHAGIRAIDRGTDRPFYAASALGRLLVAAGYGTMQSAWANESAFVEWHGSVPVVERQLTELRTKRDAALRRIDEIRKELAKAG